MKLEKTEIIGLKPIYKGQILSLIDGEHKIANIEYINMAVDRFDFENRESMFCGELKKNMSEIEFNKLKN